MRYNIVLGKGIEVTKIVPMGVGRLVLLFHNAFSVTRPYSDDRIISECCIGRGLVGSSHGLILRYQDSRLPGPRTKPETSRL
jgi:hypothetical protein